MIKLQLEKKYFLKPQLGGLRSRNALRHCQTVLGWKARIVVIFVVVGIVVVVVVEAVVVEVVVIEAAVVVEAVDAVVDVHLYALGTGTVPISRRN